MPPTLSLIVSLIEDMMDWSADVFFCGMWSMGFGMMKTRSTAQ